jgi:hypothetical protein
MLENTQKALYLSPNINAANKLEQIVLSQMATQNQNTEKKLHNEDDLRLEINIKAKCFPKEK